VAERILLDTSALIALDEQEPGAEEVEALLAEAWRGDIELNGSFATLTELEYIRTQEQDPQQASELLAFIKSQPIRWHHTDESLCSAAAKLKASHKISFADAFIAATASRLDAFLVHKDPEFNALSDTLKLRPLPEKSSK
jgi:predicted nucleic acid-binding protein